MAEPIFVNGMIVKKPENAPDFVIGKLSVKASDFKMFLDQYENNGWVNIDLLIARNGKPYAKLNDWKPQANQQQNESYNDFPTNESDGLPFWWRDDEFI